MSNIAAKLALAAPDHGHARGAPHYSRQHVWWSALAFCLSVWGVVIFAVTHYA
ncbi:MAG TPA: hypothetical protein VLL04_06055 [Rhizomicrobium sp.]|jgi:hypothetical protein|nr:hypothetical protein [Rhizomicrobium sp.]